MRQQQYAYKCPGCDQRYLSEIRGDRLPIASCHQCGMAPCELKRVFAVSLHKPIMSHYNATLQQEVTSNRDFAEKLKVRGAEYTERTGIETNYQPVDPAYLASKVDGSGLDDQNRARVARGQKEIKI